MVKHSCDGPVYSLDNVKRLASEGRARCRGLNTQLACQECFELSLDQACEEIAWLEADEYLRTYEYEDDELGNKQRPDDAYETVVVLPDGMKKRAFIKLQISDDGLELDIGSFHS